jgi:putative salt-induced outer membrane protein YdiY
MYDVSRSIKHRYGTGLGITYNLTDKDDKRIGCGVSVIREKDIPLKGEEELQNRMSGNFDLLFKLNNHVSLTTSNLYQPNIEATGDFRWQTNLSLRISLYSHFALSINSVFNYDSFPEEGIPETDYHLINSISYTF